MPDTTPEQILARAQVPPANGRPVRKDEIELDDRGIYIESWLPERRSRRKPLLFIHGELSRKFEEGGKKLVEIRLNAVNQDGERSAFGTAAAELPSRGRT